MADGGSPMLSRPRKPPVKMFLPVGSLRFTHLHHRGDTRLNLSPLSLSLPPLSLSLSPSHQLKLRMSFMKQLLRKVRSLSPRGAVTL